MINLNLRCPNCGTPFEHSTEIHTDSYGIKLTYPMTKCPCCDRIFHIKAESIEVSTELEEVKRI